jgi:hypothetical protein
MRLTRSSWLRFSLLGVFVLSPALGLCSSADNRAKYTGAYFSRAHDAGKEGSFMNLSLGYDGSATVTEDPGNGNTMTLFGHWADSGNGITITFPPQEGKPAEPAMTFASAKDGLQPVTWNHATWGKESPPPVKKGGQKVKDLYWFTQNR